MHADETTQTVSGGATAAREWCMEPAPGALAFCVGRVDVASGEDRGVS